MDNESVKHWDSLPELILLVDRDYRILWANQRAREEFRLEEGSEKKCFEILKNCHLTKCPLKEALLEKRPSRGLVHLRDCGSYFVSVSPVKDPQGEVSHLWLLLFKMGVKESGEVFGSFRYELIGRLATGLVHDIKNFLSYLMGELEILELITEEERLKRRYRKMQLVLESISVLCRRLSSLGDLGHPPELVNLNTVIQDLYPLLKLLLPEGVRLEILPDPRLKPIRFQKATLEQIILNLVTNAVEALPEREGMVEIRTLDQGDKALLMVRDNGVGIKEEIREQIFEPFFTTKEKGSGLGLSLIKEWVEESGGRISVESEEGKGSCFRIEFPVPQSLSNQSLSKNLQ